MTTTSGHDANAQQNQRAESLATRRTEGSIAKGAAKQQPGPAVSWKRNLAVMWLAQVVCVIGFSFVFPFTPLFVQELGIKDPARAAFWAGLSGSAMGLTMFLSGPIWGVLADRFGRKRNVVRAMFGGAILVALTGLSGNVYQLTALRLVTGIASGVFAPAMALVASTSPKEKIALNVGALQSAMFVGSTVGPLMGGFLAEAVGYRGAFYAAGVVIGLAGLLVLVFARENFQRPLDAGPVFRIQVFTDIWSLVTSRELAPLLATMFVVQVSPNLMSTVLPVLLDTFAPGSGATATGVAFGILGVAGAAGAYGAGRLNGRFRLNRIMTVACVGAGACYLPFMFVDSIPLLYLFLAVGGVFQGTLISSASGLVGLAMPVEKQGTGFGALQSVSAAAFGFGPLAGGTIATMTGLRSVFLVQAAGLFVAAALVVMLLRNRARVAEPALAGGAAESVTRN